MDDTQKNSINKPSETPIKKEVTGDSFEKDFSNDNSLKTNNRLAKKFKKFANQEFSHYISQCSDSSMGLMEITKLKNVLNYKDIRSVVQWCIKNGVFIIQQGNRQFVNKWEFTLSFHKPFIKHLKQKYKNWKEIFIAHLKGDIHKLVDSSDENAKPIVTSQEYKPIIDEETSFLDKIKKV